MRNRRIPFQIQYQYGSGDLYEIVNDMARDTVMKNGYPNAIHLRAKKMPKLVQVVS